VILDKKAKKRIEVLRGKIKTLQQRLAGAKQQEDEPGEVDRIEQEIAKFHEEIRTLKES
jgi:peptidoglycan hydrolase CwlO-like protein